MSRQRAEREGRKGEWQAAAWLRLQGWSVLGQRVNTPRGDIDLIVRRGGVVVFFEVKWRQHAADLDHAIDAYRLRRVAECVAHDYAAQGEEVRIDVILLAPGAFPRHIVNAWQP